MNRDMSTVVVDTEAVNMLTSVNMFTVHFHRDCDVGDIDKLYIKPSFY